MTPAPDEAPVPDGRPDGRPDGQPDGRLDGAAGAASPGGDPAHEAGGAAASSAPTPSARPGLGPGHALLVDADPLLACLLEEWLATEGLATHTVPPAGGASACRLVIVDLPYPRRGGVDSIREVAARQPGVPIIALSPTLFSSVESCGTVSRSLGVDCVLAKPTTRERLLAAVRRFVAP